MQIFEIVSSKIKINLSTPKFDPQEVMSFQVPANNSGFAILKSHFELNFYVTNLQHTLPAR